MFPLYRRRDVYNTSEIQLLSQSDEWVSEWMSVLCYCVHSSLITNLWLWDCFFTLLILFISWSARATLWLSFFTPMMWKLANDEGSDWTWAHKNGYITALFFAVEIFQVTDDFDKRKKTNIRARIVCRPKAWACVCVYEVRVSYLSMWLSRNSRKLLKQ